MAKKLYECTMHLTYYAYTETEDAASDFATEALENAYVSQCVDVREFKKPTGVALRNVLAGGWQPGDLVYCARYEGDLKLEDAYKAALENAKEKAEAAND